MFFSVLKPLKIAGKPYVPCICYECNRYLEPTINKLVSEGKAVFYDKKVAFCDGKIIEKKKKYTGYTKPKIKHKATEEDKARLGF